MTQKEYQRLKAFLTLCMVKSDGSMTKFARKYAIKKFEDFYAFFKELKQNLKKDREGFAFGMMKDMAKTYVGRVWRRMPGKSPEEKVFNAWSVTLDYIALALDNLKILQKVLRQMDTEGIEKKHLKESVEASKKDYITEDAIKKLIKALRLHT